MILINKNSTNTVVLTLAEKTTITNAYYLFEFTSDETNEVKYVIPTDISVNKLRYNEFEITEPTNVSLTSGTWKYRIFEQSSSTNLIVANATNLVENGKVDVIGTDTVLNEFTGEQKTYKEFNG